MFSKAGEYAMRAVVYIAQQSDKNQKVGVKDIAEAIKSPEAFTGKVMQQLTKKEIVTSIKGPYGGFLIKPEVMKIINMGDIIKIFDGDKAYKGCIMGLDHCDGEHPCPIHMEAHPIVNNLITLFEEHSLYDILYDNNEQLKTFWLRY